LVTLYVRKKIDFFLYAIYVSVHIFKMHIKLK